MPTAPPCVCMLFVMRLQRQYSQASAQHLLEEPTVMSRTGGDSDSVGSGLSDTSGGIGGEYYNYNRRESDSTTSTGTRSTVSSTPGYPYN
jgi:hypothetical protein